MEFRETSLDEVRQLVAERLRYDGWLAALESRRHDTPARVFARVHDDYAARRSDVLARLQAHVEGLERLAAGLQEAVAHLEAEAAALDEERIEAHLRTLVGEFAPGQWEALQQDVEGRLARLADQRAEAAVRLAEARDLLARAQGGASLAAPEPSWLAEPAQAAGAPPSAGLAATADAPSGAPFDAVPRHDGRDGAAELHGPGRLFTDVAGPAVDDDEVERALATLDAQLPVVDQATGAAAMAPPSDAPMEAAVVPGGTLPAAAPEAPAASAEPFDDLAFVRSLGGEPAAADVRKTLPCGECGTMNLSTEWYCERCGGELAAE